MLTHQAFAEATLVPTYVDAAGVRRSGLMMKDGRTVRGSLLHRGGKLYVRGAHAAQVPAERERLDRTVIYAGFMFDHYGHFLFDSLQRLWICRERPDLPIAWTDGVPARGWQRDLLAMLGVDNEIVDLRGRPTLAREVILPEEGLRTAAFLREEHARFLGCVEPRPGDGPAWVWLSRSMLSAKKGRVAEDAALERALAARGWLIYHPQEHPLRDQVAVLGAARRIAGWSSSALHTILLLRAFGGRVDVLARGDHLGESFRMIARVKGLDQREHEVPLRHIKGEGAKAQWSVDVGEALAAIDS